MFTIATTTTKEQDRSCSHTMPGQLQLNIKFLLLRARQLADILAATIADLNTNVTFNECINNVNKDVRILR